MLTTGLIPQVWKRRMVLALLIVVGLYALIVAGAFFAQARLIFPAWLVPATGPLPPGAERLELDAADGTRLAGVHLPPRTETGAGDGMLILAFAGNGSNAQALAERLRITFPDHAVAAFHYRGYAPSAGVPYAARMPDDAARAYDLLVARYRPQRVVAVGVSLGSGVATGLAARRRLDGLILVTPFDSLRAVARQIYWWLSVALLFRHDLDSVAALRDVPTPVAIVAAGRDALVRPERIDALRRDLATLRSDVVLARATHDNVTADPAFDAAMRSALDRLQQHF